MFKIIENYLTLPGNTVLHSGISLDGHGLKRSWNGLNWWRLKSKTKDLYKADISKAGFYTKSVRSREIPLYLPISFSRQRSFQRLLIYGIIRFSFLQINKYILHGWRSEWTGSRCSADLNCFIQFCNATPFRLSFRELNDVSDSVKSKDCSNRENRLTSKGETN